MTVVCVEAADSHRSRYADYTESSGLINIPDGKLWPGSAGCSRLFAFTKATNGETQPEGAMFHPKSQHPDGRSPPPPSSFTARVCAEQVFAAVILRNVRHRCVSCPVPVPL